MAPVKRKLYDRCAPFLGLPPNLRCAELQRAVFVTEPQGVTVVRGDALSESERIHRLPNGSLYMARGGEQAGRQIRRGLLPVPAQNKHGAVLSQKARVTIASSALSESLEPFVCPETRGQLGRGPQQTPSVDGVRGRVRRSGDPRSRTPHRVRASTCCGLSSSPAACEIEPIKLCLIKRLMGGSCVVGAQRSADRHTLSVGRDGVRTLPESPPPRRFGTVTPGSPAATGPPPRPEGGSVSSSAEQCGPPASWEGGWSNGGGECLCVSETTEWSPSITRSFSGRLRL
ncbi:unnamed protein product [Boreogadus saida]